MLTQILFTIIENFLIARYSDKKYKAFNNKNINPLSKEEKNSIWKNVRALSISKISHVCLNSTDNIIISTFVGISWVGLLSNFTLIVDAVTGVLSQITQAITASVGNFFAKEEKKAGYELFKKIDFMNFWLYGFSAVAMIILLNPFITLWIGEEYTLNFSTVIVIAVNFLIAGFMSTLWTFRSTLGLFTQGQLRPIVVAVINIIFSIILSFKFGVTGVLAATAISRLCVNFWYDPWIIHKYGFGVSVKPFFKKYLFRVLLLVMIVFVMYILSIKVIFLNGITFISFTLMTVLVLIIPNCVFTICFYNLPEFKYFYKIIKK